MEETILKIPGKNDFFTQEAYKVLRTNLQFCGNDIRVIALTSCNENEGKSTVTLSLGKSLSELKTEIELLHNNLNNVNARDKEIYVEKVLLGWSNDKISAKHYSLTRQQISRIVKKVEEDLKM